MRAWFTPGSGEALSARIAKHIARSRRRVRICSPVVTAAPVLATLAQLASEGRLDIAGCVDAPQVCGVIHQWSVTDEFRAAGRSPSREHCRETQVERSTVEIDGGRSS